MSENILHKDNYTHYSFTVDSNKGPISVKWSDVEELLHWNTIQSGLFLKGPGISLQLFFENFPEFNRYWWKQREDMGVFDLPDNARILDLGCGTSVVDLLLASYLPKSEFWLVDKEGWGFEKMVYYSEDYPNYHSWKPVKDAISSTGIEESRFTFLDAGDAFPEEIDCVMSSFSWCFHYPKERYWDKVKQSLKVGGKLMLDVRLLKDRDFIKEISEEFDCQPTLFEIGAIPKHIDSYTESDVVGYRCLWTRNKK